MVVKVDYLVVCSDKTNLIELLTETLENALESVDDEPPEEEELKQWIDIHLPKKRRDGCQIYRFSVAFNSAEERMEKLIRGFSNSVACSNEEGIKHLLKLKDPQLRYKLRNYGKEIFNIEMKLREALSLIYIDTYHKDFYDLLQLRNRRRGCTPDRLRKYHENQSFCLLFSEYKNIHDLNQITIHNLNQITKDQYIYFLDSLSDLVKPIEKLRNCVAHNRSIPKNIMDNYNETKGPLLDKINKFLKEQEKSKVSNETELRN